MLSVPAAPAGMSRVARGSAPPAPATLGSATAASVVAMAVLEAVSAASVVAQVGSESEIEMVAPAPAKAA